MTLRLCPEDPQDLPARTDETAQNTGMTFARSNYGSRAGFIAAVLLANQIAEGSVSADSVTPDLEKNFYAT